MKKFSLISLLALATLVSSCGEVYQATYRGTATVSKSSCGSLSAGTYVMTVQASIDSNITLKITSITRNGDSSGTSIATPLTEVQASADFSGKKESFSSSERKVYSNSDKDTYQISGSLSTSRNELMISQLSVGFDLQTPNACLITVSGNFQKDS